VAVALALPPDRRLELGDVASLAKAKPPMRVSAKLMPIMLLFMG
jgi:hypothetical protein